MTSCFANEIEFKSYLISNYDELDKSNNNIIVLYNMIYPKIIIHFTNCENIKLSPLFSCWECNAFEFKKNTSNGTILNTIMKYFIEIKKIPLDKNKIKCKYLKSNGVLNVMFDGYKYKETSEDNARFETFYKKEEEKRIAELTIMENFNITIDSDSDISKNLNFEDVISIDYENKKISN